MRHVEYIQSQLEENVNEQNKLKEQIRKKQDKYNAEKEKLESGKYFEEFEEKKQNLQDLQDRHRQELEALKQRHKEEREKVEAEFIEVKEAGRNVLKKISKEISDIRIDLNAIRKEHKALKKRKQEIEDLGEVKLTSHAIVQYLNRAKGYDIEAIKQEVKDEINNSGLKINQNTGVADHMVVDFLVKHGRIDLPAIEDEILPDDIKDLITANELLGSTGTFTTKSGFRLAVTGGKVVTFLPKKTKTKRKGYKTQKRGPKRMKL